jgi:hypothetical protein
VKQEKENLKDKIELVVRSSIKVQNTMLTQNMKNQSDMRALLSTMKEDIEASFGSTLSKEIDAVLNNLSNNLE